MADSFHAAFPCDPMKFKTPYKAFMLYRNTRTINFIAKWLAYWTLQIECIKSPQRPKRRPIKIRLELKQSSPLSLLLFRLRKRDCSLSDHFSRGNSDNWADCSPLLWVLFPLLSCAPQPPLSSWYQIISYDIIWTNFWFSQALCCKELTRNISREFTNKIAFKCSWFIA